MDSGPIATKRQLLEQLLEQGMVLVALNARREGVDIPKHLGNDPQLRLNLSYRFGLPMEIDDWGVLATLTFSGVRHDCKIPWDAIFLVVSHVTGQPYLFPEDVPSELLTPDAPGDGAEEQAPQEASEGCQHGHTGVDCPGAPSNGAARGGRPHLTVVTCKSAASGDEQEKEKTQVRAGNGAAHDSGSPPDNGSDDPPEPPSGSRPRRRGHLRVVK